MEKWWFALRILALLAVANGTPLLATWMFRGRLSAPLDGGYLFFDGRPWLGPSKTWRGVVTAICCTALVAGLLDIAPVIGAAMGAVAMLGDALSSFLKRRLGIASSGRATGLDQIPEALLPLVVLHSTLALSPIEVIAITTAFFLLEIPLARLFFMAGLRERPY